MLRVRIKSLRPKLQLKNYLSERANGVYLDTNYSKAVEFVKKIDRTYYAIAVIPNSRSKKVHVLGLDILQEGKKAFGENSKIKDNSHQLSVTSPELTSDNGGAILSSNTSLATDTQEVNAGNNLEDAMLIALMKKLQEPPELLHQLKGLVK